MLLILWTIFTKDKLVLVICVKVKSYYFSYEIVGLLPTCIYSVLCCSKLCYKKRNCCASNYPSLYPISCHLDTVWLLNIQHNMVFPLVTVLQQQPQQPSLLCGYRLSASLFFKLLDCFLNGTCIFPCLTTTGKFLWSFTSNDVSNWAVSCWLAGVCGVCRTVDWATLRTFIVHVSWMTIVIC